MISNALGMWSFETGLSSNEPEEIDAFEPQIGSFDPELDHFNLKLKLEMILFKWIEGSNKPEIESFKHGLIQMTRNWIFDPGLVQMYLEHDHLFQKMAGYQKLNMEILIVLLFCRSIVHYLEII